MILLALLGCLFTFAVANVVARLMGNLAAVFASIAGLFLSGLLMTGIFSPAVLIYLLLLIFVGIVGACRGTDAKVFQKWSLIAFAVAMMASSGIAAYGVANWDTYRPEYAFESMAERLAYEQRPAEGESLLLPVHSSPVAENHLRELESQMHIGFGGLRARALAQMHQSVVLRFINSPGFGAGRMTHVPKYYIDKIEEREPISLPPLDESDCEAFANPSSETRPLQILSLNQPAQPPSQPSRDQLWANHAENYLSFVHADGFGYIKSRRQVAGFLGHGFGESRSYRQSGYPGELGKDWRLAQLDLVSLLKFESPRAYVSDKLPRMENLQHAETRSLTEFEQQALAALQRGEDLAIDSQPHRFRMLGSLRTIKRCLECHNARRGQLLGAFSYDFYHINPPQSADAAVTSE